MSTTQLERYLGYLKTDPHNIQLLNTAADIAYQENDLGQAKALAEQAIVLDGSNAQARSILALSLMAQGEVAQAREMLDELISSGHDSPSLRYNLAYCLALEKDFESSIELLTDAEEQYANLPQMVHLKVQVLHHLAELESAIDLAKRVSDQHDDDKILYGLLSSLYIDDMAFDLAKHHAEKVLAGGPGNPDAYTSLGTLALSEQDSSKAMDYFAQAIQLKSNNGRAWLGKAMSQMLQNQHHDALLSFDEALKYMPNHLGTWQAMVWCQLAQKDLEGAERSIQQALQIDPNFSENHGTLAIIQLARGNLDHAQASIRRTLGLDRESFSGLYAQALLLQAQGNPEDAERILAGILDTQVLPGQDSLRTLLAQYLK
ncbi:tetratricopeptide repeat protein [Methylobacillus pratensis]